MLQVNITCILVILYAVCTDLRNDHIREDITFILHVSYLLLTIPKTGYKRSYSKAEVTQGKSECVQI